MIVHDRCAENTISDAIQPIKGSDVEIDTLELRSFATTCSGEGAEQALMMPGSAASNSGVVSRVVIGWINRLKEMHYRVTLDPAWGGQDPFLEKIQHYIAAILTPAEFGIIVKGLGARQQIGFLIRPPKTR